MRKGLLDCWLVPMLRNMPDDKGKTGPEDDQRINVNQDYELRDWSQKLNVTPERLKELVRQHGPMVKDVRRALGK